jgi:FKBP-type peptidyl-prolyl cis-trans isomerase
VYKRGETIDFGLNQVIQGWTEGVQLMAEGSKYKFYIPSKLATEKEVLEELFHQILI